MVYSVKSAYPLKVEEGSEVKSAIESYVYSRNLRGGVILGIGGFAEAQIGYFNPAAGAYWIEDVYPEDGRVLEVASLSGNYLVRSDGRVSVHLHVVLSDGAKVRAGHLLKGIARPFLEVFLIEIGDEVRGAFIHRDA